MSLETKVPVMVYDNRCYVCIKFAEIINFVSRGKIMIVGHYTNQGESIRKEFLDASALEMFWFIDWKQAFGGRAAILPLLKTIIFSRKNKTTFVSMDEICEENCKTVKAVFFRSASLLSNSKKIDLSKSK